MKATCFFTVRLRDLGRIVTGKTPSSKKPELFGDTYPFITPSEMGFGERTAKPVRFLSDAGAKAQASLMLPPGTVAFVCIASIGKACIVKEASFTNQQVNSIVVDTEHYDPKYVYYLLVFSRERIQSYAGGAATPIINKSDFGAIEVSVPPLPVQRRIASVLSGYDDLIENNTRRIEILEEMARRLYEEWFVQFRFPGHEGVEFKESELGLIPEGWQLLRLGDCVELAYGKALKAPDRVPGDYPVYGSSGVVGAHCESLVDGPGIILGRKGNVGSVFLSDVSFFPIDTTYYVRSDVPLSYLYFNLQRQRFLNNDAAVPGLNREQAYALPFLLPDKELLSRFGSEWEPFYGLLLRLERANVNLRAQRDLLLPKLISGEIDVSDIPMPT